MICSEVGVSSLVMTLFAYLEVVAVGIDVVAQLCRVGRAEMSNTWKPPGYQEE